MRKLGEENEAMTVWHLPAGEFWLLKVGKRDLVLLNEAFLGEIIGVVIRCRMSEHRFFFFCPTTHVTLHSRYY